MISLELLVLLLMLMLMLMLMLSVDGEWHDLLAIDAVYHPVIVDKNFFTSFDVAF